jgi:ribosomal protein S18 acetylase RimI-like enzyme
VPVRCSAVALRAASVKDDAYLRRIFAESRDDLAILPPDVRDTLIDLQYRAQRAQFAAGHPDAAYHILVADGVDAGVLMLDRGSDHVRIVDLTVERRHRRQGVAASALRGVLEEAGVRPVRLTVWAANAAARALYERLGFTETAAPVPSGYLAMERRAD